MLRLRMICVALVMTLGAAAAPAFGQTTADVPRGDVSVGFSSFHEDGGSYLGLPVSGSVRLSRHVGILGELTFCDCRRPLMGGVRVYGPTTNKVSPYVQMLVGSAPLDDIALQPGAGVDIRIERHLTIRVGGDLKIAGDDGRMFYGTRFTASVVVPLGAR